MGHAHPAVVDVLTRAAANGSGFGTPVEQEVELARLITGTLRAAFRDAEIPGTINRVGSMFTGFFNPGPVDVLAQVEQSDTAHTEADIDATIAQAREALAEL